MRTDILNKRQKSALALLKGSPEISKFYLAGGTALALHLGHRYSKDFDFFTDKQFKVESLLRGLQRRGQCQDIRKEWGTLFLEFDAILCSFIFYQYPLLDPPTMTPWGFGIVSVREIGTMKIFDDAEPENMPKMIEDVEWKEVKKFFETEVKKIVL